MYMFLAISTRMSLDFCHMLSPPLIHRAKRYCQWQFNSYKGSEFLVLSYLQLSIKLEIRMHDDMNDSPSKPSFYAPHVRKNAVN